MGIWVAELRISDATRRKIAARHHLDADDVRREIQCVSRLPYRWDEDPERGLRAIIEISVGGRRVDVVVYPQGDDIWNLGSAYPDLG